MTTEYERRKAYYQAYYQKNKESLREYEKQRRKSNPNFKEQRHAAQKKYRHSLKGKRRRVAKYGLTREAYEALWASQEGRCLGCCRLFDSLGREPDIDHDHITGAVRGLLCHGCNLILGLARDEVSTLFGLITHLESNDRGVFA